MTCSVFLRPPFSWIGLVGLGALEVCEALILFPQSLASYWLHTCLPDTSTAPFDQFHSGEAPQKAPPLWKLLQQIIMLGSSSAQSSTAHCRSL